ncbi:mannose-1-phosphate guanylyltransferase [Telluribacter humicola]|uniref:mannose-1-phosphate guanylyltransferase n=1 Tax=Telluribacter humicola TaxID=1720261 RepID=UPI001A95E79B|nr:sugar phosphate nucleotidyltransferase [Telluribacter humicola]
MSKVYHVILSGGVGSRLWPVSRKSQPKQYIPLFGQRSLFQLTAERNRSLADHIIVVGNKDNYLLSQADLTRAGVADCIEIIEAAPRNTAAAIAFSAFAAAPDDILLITPSDHIITGVEEYAQAVGEAIALARAGYIVTFGILPTKPETGYGYIEYQGQDVLSFREKPDARTAQSFLDSGSFLWNSGMFCFQASTFLNELKKHEPAIYEAALRTWKSRNNAFLPEAETMEIHSLSVDYAVMERSDRIKVVEARFGWSDLGSFESIWEYLHEQGEQQHFIKNNLVLGCNKHVEFLGVDSLVLVETPDAILVLSKEASQDVKKIYERLEKEQPELVN